MAIMNQEIMKVFIDVFCVIYMFGLILVSAVFFFMLWKWIVQLWRDE